MNILPVLEADAEELLSIYAPYVRNTAITFEYEVPTLEEFKDRIINISKKYPYIKAVDQTGQIVGYAYAGAFKGRKAYDWAVETTIYVREDQKGTGVGRALYAELEGLLKGMGILNANACIAMPNKEDPYLTDDSVRFHAHLGYEKVGTFHNCGFKFGRWYDMVWMEKMLGDHNEAAAPVRFGEWKSAFNK